METSRIDVKAPTWDAESLARSVQWYVFVLVVGVFTLCWYCGNSSFRLPRSFGAESSERLSTLITSMASSARK